ITAMPASRSARATTLAPLSCPSSAALPTTTLITLPAAISISSPGPFDRLTWSQYGRRRRSRRRGLGQDAGLGRCQTVDLVAVLAGLEPSPQAGLLLPPRPRRGEHLLDAVGGHHDRTVLVQDDGVARRDPRSTDLDGDVDGAGLLLVRAGDPHIPGPHRRAELTQLGD